MMKAAKHPFDFYQTDHSSYYDMNLIPYFPQGIHQGSKTSSFVLDAAFAALAMSSAWKDVIRHVQHEAGVGRTVWGVKQESDAFTLELYFYYPKRIEAHSFSHIKAVLSPFLSQPFVAGVEIGDYECLSFNLDSSQVSGLNIYYIEDYQKAERITAHSWFLGIGESALVKVNTYHALLQESGFHANGFHFLNSSSTVEECCRKLFPGEDAALANFYKDYNFLKAGGGPHLPVGVAEKMGAAGLYFMGLSIDQFLSFLETYNYPPAFSQRISEQKGNLSHMRYDVGVDFLLEKSEVLIKKTAFFGSI